MESITTCQVCYLNYDPEEKTPRFLPCGHTLCAKCLTQILNNQDLRKCPFDKTEFLRSQKSLASFPPNYAVRDVLEQRNKNACKTHPGERLKFICLSDQTKICSECTKHEDHKDHNIKKIKTLKAQGVKVKEDLQEALLNVKDYEQEKAENFEQIRKVFISTIDEQVKEVKSILEEKKFEWVQQVNNVIDADKNNDSEGIFAFKKQIDETIKDITNACQDENGDMMRLDQEVRGNDQNITKKRTQFLKERSSKVQNKVLEQQNSLKNALVNYKNAINSLQFSTQELATEIYSVQEDSQQLSQEELTRRHQKLKSVKFTSYFNVVKIEESLVIGVKLPQPREVEINLAELQTIKNIEIQLDRYDTLRKDPTPNVLSYLFNGLKNLVELTVFFEPDNFSNDSLSWLGETIRNQTQSLKKIDLTLSECSFNNNSMQILCDMIFCKTTGLLSIDLDLDFCQIIDADLKLLVGSLWPFHKNLNYFGIGFKGNTGITDSGVNEVFQSIASMQALKELQFDLSGLKLSNETFKNLGESVLPSLSSLDSLFLWLCGSSISDEAISSILKNLPNLKGLVLDLSETVITDNTLEVFVEEVLPRLKALESLDFYVNKTQVHKENLKKIKNISESLEKNNSQDHN